MCVMKCVCDIQVCVMCSVWVIFSMCVIKCVWMCDVQSCMVQCMYDIHCMYAVEGVYDVCVMCNVCDVQCVKCNVCDVHCVQFNRVGQGSNTLILEGLHFVEHSF